MIYDSDDEFIIGTIGDLVSPEGSNTISVSIFRKLFRGHISAIGSKHSNISLGKL